MKFVLDTQIFIHYNMFSDCDWSDLLKSDDLELIIVPTVLGEIDEKKYDQRDNIKKKAKEVSAKFHEVINGKPLRNGIKVIFVDVSSETDYNANGLNESNKDDKIIAEILTFQRDVNEEICLITADVGLTLKAKSRGIRVLPPPPEWEIKGKDPRDKRIKELEEFIQKNYPELKLYFPSEEGNLVESFSGTVGIETCESLSDQEINKQISDMKLACEEKLSQIKRENSRQILPHMRISEWKIEEYEKELKNYIDEYTRYLIEFSRIQEKLLLIIEIPLVMINEGNAPAEDIDVRIRFPNDVRLINKIPEIPKRPDEPEKPFPVLSDIARMANFERPDFTQLLTDIKPFNEDNREEGPDIDVSTNTALFWKRKLKHDFLRDITLYCMFNPGKKPHTFLIEYYINAGNHPKPKMGKLTFLYEGQD
jgi:hypothetical protein